MLNSLACPMIEIGLRARRDELVSFKEEEQEEQEEEQQQPEPSFRKVDKRHSAQERAEQEAVAEQAEEAEQEPEEVEETAAEQEMPATEVDVYDTLRFVISMLARQAWIMMGVQIAPGATELKQDLVQAKIAIDTLEFIVGKLEPQLDAGEKSEVDALLTNLRINYVKKA